MLNKFQWLSTPLKKLFLGNPKLLKFYENCISERFRCKQVLQHPQYSSSGLFIEMMSRNEETFIIFQLKKGPDRKFIQDLAHTYARFGQMHSPHKLNKTTHH